MLKSAIVLCCAVAGLTLSACSTTGMADQGTTRGDRAPASQAPYSPPSPPPSVPSSGGYGY